MSSRAIIQIDVEKDSVTIEGQKVLRPSRISPSQWYAAWNALKKAYIEATK